MTWNKATRATVDRLEIAVVGSLKKLSLLFLIPHFRNLVGEVAKSLAIFGHIINPNCPTEPISCYTTYLTLMVAFDHCTTNWDRKHSPAIDVMTCQYNYE